MAVTNGNGALAKAGSLYNNGEITGEVRVDKDGYVEVAEGSIMVLKGSATEGLAEARVNNTAGGNISVPENSKYIVYHEFDDCNLMDLYELKYDLYNINTIVVKGKFTFDTNDLKEATDPASYFLATAAGTKFGKAVRRLELNNGSELNVAAGTKTGVGFENIFVAGDVKIKGWSKEQSEVYLGKGVQVHLALNSELTVSNVTVMTGNDEIVTGATEAKVVCETEGKTTDDKYGQLVVKGNANVVVTGTNAVNVDEKATAE